MPQVCWMGHLQPGYPERTCAPVNPEAEATPYLGCYYQRQLRKEAIRHEYPGFLPASERLLRASR